MILLKKKQKLGRHFPDTVHSLVLQRFCLYLTTFRGKGVVPRTVAWYAKICDKGGWSICVHTAVVTCTCCWCASMYADMEKPVATLSEWRPQGSSRKKRREREREQARPEYRMSGIFISRCHSWKVASFPWEKFFSVDATEWTCNAQRAKSKAARLIVRNQMLRRNLDPAAENYLAMRIEWWFDPRTKKKTKIPIKCVYSMETWSIEIRF